MTLKPLTLEQRQALLARRRSPVVMGAFNSFASLLYAVDHIVVHTDEPFAETRHGIIREVRHLQGSTVLVFPRERQRIIKPRVMIQNTPACAKGDTLSFRLGHFASDPSAYLVS